jgi:methylated-DNA-[protein]-cysteine S-methyltransferase
METETRPGVTDFQRRVYDALIEVPAGQVTTYGLLAQRVGCRAPRAIGQALRCNPFAPRVPCHRVIASDLTLGGFAGQTEGPEIARKRRLLADEGVRFDGITGRLAEPERRMFRWEDAERRIQKPETSG